MIDCVDESTMAQIQLRAPAVSKCDYEFITRKMRSGELFPGINDSVKRTNVLQHLLAIDYLIPSLFTLFRDIRYLEPAAELLKALVPPIQDTTATLRGCLRSHFMCLEANDTTLPVQQSEGSYIKVAGNYQDLFELALRQLWLCSFRYVSITVGNAPKRDMNPVKRTTNAPNYFLWFKLVELAHHLGFKSPEITRVLQDDPVERVVVEMLAKFLPPQMGTLDDTQAHNVTRIIKGYLNRPTIAVATAAVNRGSAPCATVPGLGEPVVQRCGIRADDGPENIDRSDLFLYTVHAPSCDYQNTGDDISSFFVKRCRYLAFLGPTRISDVVRSHITEVSQEAVVN